MNNFKDLNMANRLSSIIKTPLTINFACLLIICALLVILVAICFVNKFDDIIQIGLLFAAIANAILLFNTLIQQKQTVYRERFESTFFNLLQSHINVAQATTYCTAYFDENYTNIQQKIFVGNECFAWISLEMRRISECLSYPKYLGQWNETKQKEKEEYESYIESEEAKVTPETYETAQSHMREIYTECSHSLTNLLYHITSEDYDNAHELDNSHMSNVAFGIFITKHGYAFSHYLRNTKQLLYYIMESSITDKGRYIEYLKAQMTNEELNFLQLYRKTDTEFDGQLTSIKKLTE